MINAYIHRAQKQISDVFIKKAIEEEISKRSFHEIFFNILKTLIFYVFSKCINDLKCKSNLFSIRK
jgi:hypothetical protein